MERRESHRANQVYALTTHQLQVERRESHRDNQVYALTTHQLQVERRESQSSGWGLLGGHDRQGPVEGIWPGHRGYTPTLYEKCHGIFNNHRESEPRFNVSSERRCFWQYSVSVTSFLRRSPIQVLTSSTLLSFSEKPVLGCRVIWLWP